MKIQNCTAQDLDRIFSLYKAATDYQKKTFASNVWPVFERSLVENEINEQRQFKISNNGEIACVWAITFEDPQIWGEKNKDPAIYIHRIATHPGFRGHNFVGLIADWAQEYAASRNKMFVRMDTCGNNQKLIAHYKKCGFRFLGIHTLENTDQLPSHYYNADVCLFEIRL